MVSEVSVFLRILDPQLHATICHIWLSLPDKRGARGIRVLGGSFTFALPFFILKITFTDLVNRTRNLYQCRGDVVLTATPLVHCRRGRACLWQSSDPSWEVPGSNSFLLLFRDIQISKHTPFSSPAVIFQTKDCSLSYWSLMQKRSLSSPPLLPSSTHFKLTHHSETGGPE